VSEDTGFLEIWYKEGDMCDVSSGSLFSSRISYICDASIEFGKPVYLGTGYD
jgi:hypothetical protein